MLKIGATSGGNAGRRVRLLLSASALGGVESLPRRLKTLGESLEGRFELGSDDVLRRPQPLAGAGRRGISSGSIRRWWFFSAAQSAGWCSCPVPPCGDAGCVTGVAAAKVVWSGQIRYIGIGAMLVGGVWTLIQVSRPILHSLRQLLSLYAARRDDRGASAPLRTERDAGVVWLIGLTVASLIPMVFLYRHLLDHSLLLARD